MNTSGTLRAARRQAGLSQVELARLAGVPQSTVGRIEAGLTVPAVDTYQRLLAVCGHGLQAFTAPRQPRRPQGDETPYFLWDMEMSWAEFARALRSPDSDVRCWAFSRLLEHANWSDVWRLVKPSEVAANLPCTRFRTKPLWERLFASASTHPSSHPDAAAKRDSGRHLR